MIRRLLLIASLLLPTPALAQFYVATSGGGGSDSNPGTLASPFLTLGKCQTAMRAGPYKTCYIRAGTYTMAAELTLTSSDNGETWAGYPGDTAQSAMIQYSGSAHLMFHVTGGSDITIQNLKFDGGASGGNNTSSGAIFIENSSNNIHVESNLFTNNFNQSDLYFYNSNNIYFRGNTSNLNEYQPVSGHVTDSTEHTGWFITDNTLNHWQRMGIELQGNAGSAGGVKVDRNVIDMTNTPTGGIALSIVTKANNTCNTIWGNTLSGTFASGQWGIEVDFAGPASTDSEQNVFTNVNAPYFIANAVGLGVQNNTASNWGGGGFGNYVFNQDGGGYTNTQWIGTNTLNSVSTAGWTGHPNSGAQPASCAPSATFAAGSQSVVVTFDFAANAQSFVSTPATSVTMSWVSGTLESDVAVKNLASRASRWDRTLTYQAMGVPAGATVTGITSAAMQSQCTFYTSPGATHQSGAATLTDGATVVTLSAARNFTATDAAMVTTGGTNSGVMSSPSSNSVALRINNTLSTANTTGAHMALKQDNLTFTITYTPAPASSTHWSGAAGFPGRL